MPTSREIPAALLIGAALFGLGWGLAGYCPGPAVVSLATGAAAPILFVIAMLLGMMVFRTLNRALGGIRR